MLADVKMGKKLGMIVGVGVVQLVCMTLLVMWVFSSMASHIEVVQNENELMVAAKGATLNIVAAVNQLAGMMLDRRVDAEAKEQLAATRKLYTDGLEQLKKTAGTSEGRRLVDDIVRVTADWRQVNVRALDLLQAGKAPEATKVFQEEGMPQVAKVRAASDEFMKFQQAKLDEAEVGQKALSTKVTWVVSLVALLSLAGAVIVGMLISRSITAPLTATVHQLERIAEGNVSTDVPQEYQDRRDEFGDIAKAVHKVWKSLRDMVKNMTEGVQVLAASATELSSNSDSMTHGSHQASDRAHAVAAAAEEMSSNATSVAAGMEQTSTNLANVTLSTEQMTSTIGEIANNSEKARKITGEATRQAGQITSQMNELGQAAREIGKVTETITEISSQTNLLALNATIEAARAGAAGKGFAVVANEIKELAQQTAAATEDIKARIAGVQNSTATGISEIERISLVIHEVSDIVSTIATAIEEQATVTKDIARNIAEASTGVNDANTRVAETSQASRDIAREISEVDRAARDMTNGSEQVLQASGELSRVAEQLRGTVAKFTV